MVDDPSSITIKEATNASRKKRWREGWAMKVVIVLACKEGQQLSQASPAAAAL